MRETYAGNCQRFVVQDSDKQRVRFSSFKRSCLNLEWISKNIFKLIRRQSIDAPSVSVIAYWIAEWYFSHSQQLHVIVKEFRAEQQKWNSVDELEKKNWKRTWRTSTSTHIRLLSFKLAAFVCDGEVLSCRRLVFVVIADNFERVNHLWC